ncbi:MAG: ATP-binding cassette domain-containing protein [Candidatus Dormibacteria bacterium]
MSDLVIEDLTVEYTSGDYVVRPIDGLNLSSRSGELVLLLGPSGCGKTTLLSCLAGILTPTSGRIHVGSTEVTRLRDAALTHYRRHTVGIVFQAFNLIPSLTAQENVEAPLRAAGQRGRQAARRATELLVEVGLEDRRGHRPSHLSGGQQQRVAIARALAHEPRLLIADEPTAHLDYVQVEGVLRILRDLARPGRSVVVATHDERMLPLADRVVELRPRSSDEGRREGIVRVAAGEVIFEQGSRGDLIYVVESGRVELLRRLTAGGTDVLAVAAPGDYFGELGALMGFPRAAEARAKTAATLRACTVSEFRRMFGPGEIAEVIAGRRPRARKARAG